MSVAIPLTNLFGELTSSLLYPRAKPFVKWVGGKSQLLPTIAPILMAQADAKGHTHYIEPFVGGGAMLFYLLEHCPTIQRATINDINPDLVNCYCVVRDRVSELIEMLSDYQEAYYTLQAEEDKVAYFLRCRERFNARLAQEVEQTALFILLNRTCFNGLYRVNRKGEYNVPFGRAIRPTICDASTLRADSRLLQKVEICQGDYAELLPLAGNDSLWYLDPPYKPLSTTSSFNSYAKEAFGDEEQERLQLFCDSLTRQGASLVLSNSDALGLDGKNYFDALYRGYQVERVWARRAVNSRADKRGKITEVLIRNFTNSND